MQREPVDRRLSGTRGSILTLLRKRDRTVAQIASTLGITGNGVRLHLGALEREGLVERRDRVPGVSKPSQRYGLAPSGRLAFSRAHALLLGGILDALKVRAGGTEPNKLLAGVARRLARTIPKSSGTFRERMNVAVQAFRNLGGDPVLEREGGTVRLVMHHCPLGDLVASHPEVCTFGTVLVSELIDGEVAGRCVHGNRPRCRFEIEAPRTGVTRS